jgi:hypothetical protein
VSFSHRDLDGGSNTFVGIPEAGSEQIILAMWLEEGSASDLFSGKPI